MRRGLGSSSACSTRGGSVRRTGSAAAGSKRQLRLRRVGSGRRRSALHTPRRARGRPAPPARSRSPARPASGSTSEVSTGAGAAGALAEACEPSTRPRPAGHARRPPRPRARAGGDGARSGSTAGAARRWRSRCRRSAPAVRRHRGRSRAASRCADRRPRERPDRASSCTAPCGRARSRRIPPRASNRTGSSPRLRGRRRSAGGFSSWKLLKANSPSPLIRTRVAPSSSTTSTPCEVRRRLARRRGCDVGLLRRRPRHRRERHAVASRRAMDRRSPAASPRPANATAASAPVAGRRSAAPRLRISLDAPCLRLPPAYLHYEGLSCLITSRNGLAAVGSRTSCLKTTSATSPRSKRMATTEPS